MKKIFSVLIGLATFIALSNDSLAYIPDFKMIMSRTAENHGRGIYKIEQEVSFQEGAETLLVRETWYVKSSQEMRLEVRGRKKTDGLIAITFVYDNGRRFYVDTNGAKKVSRPSDDWFDPYLHFRFQKNIRPRMVGEKIIPADALEDKPQPADPTKAKASQSFVRLSRVGGVVAYAFGEPTPAGASATLPGLWIEQDNFNVRKIRLPSQSVISADEYSGFSNRLSLPTLQSVRWDDKSVQIRVLSVKSLANSKDVLRLFDSASLDFGKDPSLAIKVPEIGSLTDFYKRFR